MKLYATITSERATKGQGGKYLMIDIYGEKKEKRWAVYVIDDILKVIAYTDKEGQEVFKTSKVKKETGDINRYVDGMFTSEGK